MSARAGSEAARVAAAADALVAAHEAGDLDTFRTLARRARPDPWRVADELCFRGATGPAHDLARHALVDAPDRLQVYVEARTVEKNEKGARSLLRLARKALERGSARAALGVLDDVPASRAVVLAVDVATLRGQALRHLREFAASGEAFRSASEIAATAGWTRGAMEALARSAASAAAGADHAAALARWQRVVRTAERLEDGPALADACTGVGTAQRNLGAYEAALEWHERARRLHEEQADVSGVARALGNLAIAQRGLGRLDEALDLQGRALALHRDLGDEAAVATTLGNLGVIRAARGELDLALEAQREALDLKQRLGDTRGAVVTLTNLGSLHVERGDYERALDLGRRALELNRALRDGVGLARAMVGLANVHTHFGDHPRALDLLERAREQLADLDRSAELAAVLSNLGIVHRRLGDLPAAVRTQSEALAHYERMHDPAGRARAHVNLGVVYRVRGDYPRALHHAQAALDIAETHRDTGAAAAALGGLGNVYLRLGAHDRALDLHARSLALNEKRGDRRATALTLTSIGALHALLGEAEKAHAGLERACELFAAERDAAGEVGAIVNRALLRRQGGESDEALRLLRDALVQAESARDEAGAALIRVNLGLVHAARREPEEALALLEAARAWGEEAGATEIEVRACWGLASVRLGAGAPRKALAHAHDAVDRLALLVGGQGEVVGARARTQFLGVFETGARAGATLGDVGEVAWFLEGGRAGALLESLGGRDALHAEVVAPELRRAEAEARASERTALARLRHARARGALRDIRTRRRELDAARERLRGVVERLQREAKASAHLLLPKPDDLATIRGRLRAGDALVLYALFDGASFALVVTSAQARLVRLAPREEIVEACDALLLDDPPYVDETAVVRLRGLLLEPLSLHEETKRLLLSPDGILGYVPFCLLAPARPIVYLPSATTLGHLRREAAEHGSKILALGDPDYGNTRRGGGEDVYASLYRTGLRQLPATRAEVEAIGDVVLVGVEASEKGFRRAVMQQRGWRAIHFACHGLVDPERPTLSSLALSVDDENDGFLTAMEVFRMRLSADLVVLSACETGRGEIVRGEGIVGLTRAFMFAGAPRVLVSLWEVDDEATSVLMRRFYELWNPESGPLPAAQALCDAQAYVRDREAWRHPRFWAAWSLWGLAE